jgi:hypothetical protein
MDAYEIRLLNARGETILLYFTQSASEADARRRLTDIHNVDYVKYEIWRGMTLLGEGAKDAPPEQIA